MIGNIAAILDISEPHRIGMMETLNELGMDSVTLVELRDQLQLQLKCDIPTRLLFDFPQIGKLIQHLHAELNGGESQQEQCMASDTSDSPKENHNHKITDHDIAIVGIACRFPGHVNSPEEFWSALQEGRDLVGEINALRWDAKVFVRNKQLATIRAGIIDNIDSFDCGFFGITPREAHCMDPQQRLLLETGWEALERAGYDFSSTHVNGGIFIGPGPDDYAKRFPTDAESLSHHHSTGNALSVTAGRLAFTLDWQGPTLAVDTACSSSLMAVHLAIQALRQGECNIALAGGINLLLSPETSVLLSKGKMLAPDGRCKTFDAAADGYVRSEGCGLVVLKCLEDAIADGDNVIAVIRGSAANQDGHSQGLTAPNGQSQQRVLRRALRDAKVDPAQVEVLEAHGTGTPLGDPIEMSAAQAVYVDGVSRQSSLWVSSVKTNMGHAEAAAGIAGLIKTALCLYHQTIVPHLHLTKLNSEIQLAPKVRIPSVAQPWQSESERYAAISSFGFSGTNVHMILQSAPANSAVSTQACLPAGLRISAATEVALNDMMAAYLEMLTSLPADRYVVFCQQSWRRAELECTRIFESASQADMISALRTILKGSESVSIVGKQTSSIPMIGMPVPCYRFQRQRFWQQSVPSVRKESSAQCHLGIRLSSKKSAVVVYAVDYLNQPPFNLKDHLVHDELVVPAAAHLALIIGMLRDFRGIQTWEILDVLCEDTLIVDADTEVVRYEFNMISEGEGEEFSISVHSEHDEGAREYLRARARVAESQPAPVIIPKSARILADIDERTFYDDLYSSEIMLSHAFRSILSIKQFVGYSESEVIWRSDDSSVCVPGELDSLLQTIALATEADQPGTSHMGGATIPVAIDRLLVAPIGGAGALHPHSFICHTQLKKEEVDGSAFVHDIALSIQGEQPFLSIEGLCTRRVSAQQLKSTKVSSSYLKEGWVAESLSQPPEQVKSELPTVVLLNSTEEIFDPDIHSSLARMRVLNSPTIQDIEKVCSKGCEVILLYCLPQCDLNDKSVNQEFWGQATMALVSVVRRAYDISEALLALGITTRFQVLSKGHVKLEAKSGGSPLFGFASGLCKSLNLEWSNCPVGMLDVDEFSLQQYKTLFEDEIQYSQSDWVTYNCGQRYVLRVEEVSASSIVGPNAFDGRHNGLYLLTGGLGDLAIATCQWLVTRGAKRFLLLGRRPETEQISQQLQRLRESTDAQIDYKSCDVADRDALAELLSQDDIHSSLCGIFHCAGVLADGVFSSLGDDEFEYVTSSKVAGSWHLHELTQDMTIDCFVMYSSLASLFGAAGQSNYAAANSFMDQLAHYRKGLGLPALAINWSGWDQIGMAAGKTSNTGLRLLSPERAIMDLERLMSSDITQAGVIDVDWSIIHELWRESPPALVKPWLASHQIPLSNTAEKHDSTVNLLEELRELPPMVRLDHVREHLRQITRQIMKLDENSVLDDHKPFQDFGFDSLMSIELKQKLYEKLHIRVPATLIFDYPNVESLAIYVIQALELEHVTTKNAQPSTSESMDELDEHQLAQILESLL